MRCATANLTSGIGNPSGGYTGTMTDTRTELLPLLPLNTGVVLPGMVVTITLESDEAKRAAAAAEAAGGRMVLVPRIDGRFSTVGTITQIESAGELPNGSRALVVRGTGRARIGSGVPGRRGRPARPGRVPRRAGLRPRPRARP